MDRTVPEKANKADYKSLQAGHAVIKKVLGPNVLKEVERNERTYRQAHKGEPAVEEKLLNVLNKEMTDQGLVKKTQTRKNTFAP